MRSFKKAPLFIASVAASLFSTSSLVRAEGSNAGICAIESNAPPALEKALDQVLQQSIGNDLAHAPALIAKLFDGKIGAAPGAVISVQGPGWRYFKAAGLADPDTGTAVNCEMPFEIGSNTKMMTATVILQLQEEGRLKLDDLLSLYVPKIAARLPNGDAITLRHLANHTSGLFNYTDNAPDGAPGLMEGGMLDRDMLRKHLEPLDIIDFVVAHGKPQFSPGEAGKWSYSNTGFALLGLVIERIEGRAINKAYEERIFGPLGMTHSFLWDSIPRQDFGLARAWLAAPYTYETSDWNMSQGWAAGAVISTPNDMHIFIEALVAGKLFKSPGTLVEMQKTVPTNSPTEIGYGVGLKEIMPGLWGHGGQTMGFLSVVADYPDQLISYVAWGNSAGNLLGLGDIAIDQALRETGVLRK